MNAPSSLSAHATSRRTWLVGAVALAAAAGGAGWAWWRGQGGASANDQAVQALWATEFQTPQGTPLAMRQFAGKPVLVNFWATWCPPCVRELPMLDDFAKRHPELPVLGIAVDQAPAVQKFLARQPLGFTVAMAGSGGTTLTRSLGNVQGGLPFSILLDRQGNVSRRKMGELTVSDLAQWAGN